MRAYAFFGSVILSIIVVSSTGCTGAPDKKASGSFSAADIAAKNNENQKNATGAAQNNLDSLTQKKIDENRKKIVKEAINAVRETENALTALDSNNTKEALKALENATGELEIILARDPELAMAPVDVNIMTYDMLTSVNAVKKMRGEVRKLIDKGDLQEARRLIKNMCSEIVVSVVNLPLATYPEAIKAISPLIDQGKITEAKIALADVLSTLVVTEHVIPLPVIRADAYLTSAQSFAEKKERNKSDNDSLAVYLESAQYQLQMAEALGYGSKKDFKNIYNQLNAIKEQTKGGKSAEGFFDKIKDSLGALREKLFK